MSQLNQIEKIKTIKNVVEWLEQGKKVTHSSWHPDEFIMFKDDHLVEEDGSFFEFFDLFDDNNEPEGFSIKKCEIGNIIFRFNDEYFITKEKMTKEDFNKIFDPNQYKFDSIIKSSIEIVDI